MAEIKNFSPKPIIMKFLASRNLNLTFIITLDDVGV